MGLLSKWAWGQFFRRVDAELLPEEGRFGAPREDDRTTAGAARIRMELSRVRARLGCLRARALTCAGVQFELPGLSPTRG